MEQLIDGKRENREPPTAEEPEAPAQVVDLMAALKESVAKARQSRRSRNTILVVSSGHGVRRIHAGTL
ncbi:hypothetical protein [Streptomyces sp. NPDC127038]|uniref:hypothetical protein n=1 Tax=Streptomyces sp. NPDC127038 TaxID=3347114 RepID=UPI00365CEB90